MEITASVGDCNTSSTWEGNLGSSVTIHTVLEFIHNGSHQQYKYEKKWLRNTEGVGFFDAL